MRETRVERARRALHFFLSQRGIPFPDHLEFRHYLKARIVCWDGWGEKLPLATLYLQSGNDVFVHVHHLELLAPPMEKFPQAMRGPESDTVTLPPPGKPRFVLTYEF
jgi:hypothetical protein